jgi:hypothetical protein
MDNFSICIRKIYSPIKDQRYRRVLLFTEILFIKVFDSRL